MESTWSLLRNTFDNVTKFNFKRMLLMARDHRDKLRMQALTNSDINAIYVEIVPAFNHFEQTYNEVASNFAQYQAATQHFEEKLSELSSKYIKKWDITIQMELDDQSAAYKGLLPNGRAPFQSGAYELRLSAVKTLILNLQKSNKPTLTALADTIQLWYTEADAIRTKQQGVEQVNTILRQEIENARAELSTVMHTAFFKLCVIYSRNLAKVETFYELKYLRTTATKKEDIIQTNTGNALNIPSMEVLTIQQDIQNPLQEFGVLNMGDTVISLWSSNQANSLPHADALIVYPQQTVFFSVEEISDGSATPTFLRAKNMDTSNTGKLKIIATEYE